MCVCYLVLFNSNNFTTSAALTEVCALLSAVLVFTELLNCDNSQNRKKIRLIDN